MIVVTTPWVPGYRVVESLGLCFGLIVRSRGIGPNIAAAFRSLGGGEINEYTALLEETRQHAVARLVEHATVTRWQRHHLDALRQLRDGFHDVRDRGLWHGRHRVPESAAGAGGPGPRGVPYRAARRLAARSPAARFRAEPLGLTPWPPVWSLVRCVRPATNWRSTGGIQDGERSVTGAAPSLWCCRDTRRAGEPCGQPGPTRLPPLSVDWCLR